MVSKWREDLPLTTNPLRFFLFVSRPHWKPACIAIFFVLIADVISASVAYVFKYIADAAAALPDPGAYQTLFWSCAAYIGFLGLAKLLWRVSGFAGSYWAMGNLATARHALTAYVTLHSRNFFSNRFAGSLANKISHAARGVREFVEQILWQFLELLVIALTSLAIVFTVNLWIALIFLAWVIVVFLTSLFLVRSRIPLTAYAHHLETGLNGSTVDLMSNMNAVQDYARRRFELHRLMNAVDTRRLAGLKNWHFGEWIRVLNSVLLVIFGGAMTFLVIYFAQIGVVSLGDVILVIAVIFRIEGLLQSFGSNLNVSAELWGEVKESLEQIVEPYEIVDKDEAVELMPTKGEIVLENVSFGYSGLPVFKNVFLAVAPGERVGLVGKSGAGKSTLVRLLLRHHDLESGFIRIDGVDIASISQESLRRSIAIVPQEPLLFHRSIRENIAYGSPHATEEEIQRAATLAQADRFIQRLSKGYDSLVGERGVKLSGGERQRIAIARAILKNAPILLLDEATSSLDSESEGAIQESLRALMQGKTVIAIAHRLSTLREMDRLVVLDNGAIVEDGTHEELLKKGGIYAELWRRQAGGFIQDE